MSYVGKFVMIIPLRRKQRFHTDQKSHQLMTLEIQLYFTIYPASRSAMCGYVGLDTGFNASGASGGFESRGIFFIGGIENGAISMHLFPFDAIIFHAAKHDFTSRIIILIRSTLIEIRHKSELRASHCSAYCAWCLCTDRCMCTHSARFVALHTYVCRVCFNVFACDARIRLMAFDMLLQ